MHAGNLLLASLSAGDAAALKPHLNVIHLEHQKVLFEAGDPINVVYFPSSAIISLVVGLSTGEMIEAAMVGRDGVIGASAALDGRISLSRAIVQLEGASLTCQVDVLKGAALQSSTLLSKLIRHEQTLYAQAQQSTACMAAHAVEARLCRWLLRARDLSDSDTLSFTQELLAEMLGVRRTSVTLVAHSLQQAGMIKYARGKIQILNLEGLRETACECYETVNSHYRALLGATAA
ncbi:Crp/Fnr family transcriptional regulator [uncultured Bradyrhizobium sp.]|uniref:Crp/Fnr family transcriptional regulator n=1 Tax=uncultured Bradyrhizobium sp. TaxID=199684 RepID=UPI0035CA0CA2